MDILVYRDAYAEVKLDGLGDEASEVVVELGWAPKIADMEREEEDRFVRLSVRRSLKLLSWKDTS